MKNTVLTRSAAVGLMALVLATALPASHARAATLDQLQAQITALLAQIAALQKQVDGTQGTCSPLFVSDLTIGRSGAEVTSLQKFLISKGYSIPAGATGYFGVQTQSALAAFQRAENIAPAAGYFGPLTRAKVNALCVQTPVTPPVVDEDEETPAEQPLRGEASFERFDVRSGDKSNLQEGMKNVSIMDIEFRVEDGDARINRIDLGFTPDNANNEKDPWDTFKEVAIYDGDDRIARINASDEDAWEEDTPANGDYRLRFTGINTIVKEGTEVNWRVEVTTHSNIKGANDGEVWDIFVLDNGIRGLDADRANIYVGDRADSITIDIDEAGSTDELIVKRSDEDPDATTLALKSSGRSGWTEVFAFDIDTDDSDNDIMIRKLPVELTVSSSTVNTFMHDVRIIIDGKTYTKKTVVDGATNTVTFEFNKGDLVIDAGDRATAVVEIDFKQLQSSNEGTTLRGKVQASQIIAEGANDLSGSQLSGTVQGELHTLRTAGAIIEVENTTAVKDDNTNATKEDDEGVYSVKFSVTAFGNDLYIARSTERGTTLATGGVNFTIEDASLGGIETASGTVSAVLTSNAKIEGDYYKVSEGETKTFTVSVVYDPETESFYNVQLHSLNWDISGVAPTKQQLVLPTSKFETPVLSI